MLLPATLQEWLPPDHLAYFVSDVVDQLDLHPHHVSGYQSEERGGPPYHPRMMVKVLVCTATASEWPPLAGLPCVSTRTSPFRVLAANNTPDFRTISDFRKDHLGALAGLFLQVLELCRKAGLVKLGHVALDGTKVKANASRHKAMSYGRMKEKEAELAREVDELLKRAQEVDEEEDRRYGRDRRGDELPEELAFRESRLRKVREAKAALEAEAKEAAEQAEGEGRSHSGVPEDKTQRNFTDRRVPDHASPPGGRDFIQGYNCQAVVDCAHQVIVAARATNRPSDKGQAVGMIQETVFNTGAVPREVSADAGYYSAQTVDDLYALGGGPLRRSGSDSARNGNPASAPGPHTGPSVGRGPDAAEVEDETGATTLRTADEDGGTGVRAGETGPGLLAVPAAGTGEVANREWLMICTGHNLLKLFRFGRAQPRHEPRAIRLTASALGVHLSVESGVSFDEHR